jgi:hypothetical protein
MGIAVNSKFEALNNKGEAIPGLYAAGDTCTIYGGLVLTRPMGGMGAGGGAPGAAAASSDASPAVAAPGAGPSGGPSGNMPPMSGGGSVKTTDISGEGSPCGGSNAALISGYYAALGVGDFLKNI